MHDYNTNQIIYIWIFQVISPLFSLIKVLDLSLVIKKKKKNQW